MRRFSTLILMMGIILQLSAQEKAGTVYGRVFDNVTDSTLQEVNIRNIGTNALARSDAQGRYQIKASEGDKILFSIVGYLPDTLVVEFQMFSIVTDIGLFRDTSLLDPVTINAPNYQADSIARRNEYRHILDEPQTDIRGKNRPENGFGISISPFTYFSKSAREERQLRKKLLKQEEDAYIDFRFSPAYVSRVTGLRDEQLRLFMYRYRPSYTFARNATPEDMLLYINDNLKKFRR